MRFCLLALTLFASPALADDYIAFHSPSGNIHCALYAADVTGVRCDIYQLTPTYTKRPDDCEFDWGNSFELGVEGKGYLSCVGDAVGDDMGRKLGYGESVTLGTITCTSQTTGMTCTNPGGHGFSLSKAKQRVF